LTKINRHKSTFTTVERYVNSYAILSNQIACVRNARSSRTDVSLKIRMNQSDSFIV